MILRFEFVFIYFFNIDQEILLDGRQETNHGWEGAIFVGEKIPYQDPFYILVASFQF